MKTSELLPLMYKLSEYRHKYLPLKARRLQRDGKSGIPYPHMALNVDTVLMELKAEINKRTHHAI